MEAVSTCTFTAGVEEDVEKFHAKCTDVVLTKCLPGGCPLETTLHRACICFPALGKDGMDLPAKEVRFQHFFMVYMSDCLGFG